MLHQSLYTCYECYRVGRNGDAHRDVAIMEVSALGAWKETEIIVI